MWNRLWTTPFLHNNSKKSTCLKQRIFIRHYNPNPLRFFRTVVSIGSCMPCPWAPRPSPGFQPMLTSIWWPVFVSGIGRWVDDVTSTASKNIIKIGVAYGNRQASFSTKCTNAYLRSFLFFFVCNFCSCNRKKFCKSKISCIAYLNLVWTKKYLQIINQHKNSKITSMWVPTMVQILI